MVHVHQETVRKERNGMIGSSTSLAIEMVREVKKIEENRASERY